MLNIFKNLFDSNEKELSKLRKIVDKVNNLEPEISQLSDEELRSKSEKLRSKVKDSLKNINQKTQEILEDNLPEALAIIREAINRTVGERAYDVQVMAAIVLHQGKIAEQKTGEGKSLAAAMTIFVNALLSQGIHLVTVNDYLARRDAGWYLGPAFHLLGMSVGCIIHEENFLYDPGYAKEDEVDKRLRHLRPCSRQQAYQADITVGTNNEFGFDYLRDNMVYDQKQMAQRQHHYAIVDEVDSILIDEARTPLIISAPAEESTSKYYDFAKLATRLTPKTDYEIDEKSRTANLTELGVRKIEKWLEVDNLYEKNFEALHHIEQALKARTLFQRDRDYIVKDDQVIIVDEFTGRLMPGRRFSEGLHQALEAKENVAIQKESRTLATISFQNYFRMYKKLAGMTGTAVTEAEEFHKIYNLDVVVIPTNKPLIRKDHSDVVYKTQTAKYRAIVNEIEKCQKRGQPVLVGTTSVEKNELLHKFLNRKNISHEILNAKNHVREALIIAQAGKKGAVTVATNMAGRGVDIVLGGAKPEKRSEKWEVRGENQFSDQQSAIGNTKTQKHKNTKTNNNFQNEENNHQNQLDQQEKENLSKQINNQQSTINNLESDYQKQLDQWKKEHDQVINFGGLHIIGTERHESRRIDNQLRGRAGRQGDPGSSRFFVSLQDDLMRIFGGETIEHLMDRMGMDENIPLEHRMVSKSIENAQTRVEGHNFDIRKHLVEYDDVINTQREIVYGLRRKVLALTDDASWLISKLQKFIEVNLQNIFSEQDKKLGKNLWRQVVRQLSLQVIDILWIEHLDTITDLREGIGLRGFGQRDPLVEYKKESHILFEKLMNEIYGSIADRLSKVEVEAQPIAARPVVTERAQAIHRSPGSALEPSVTFGSSVSSGSSVQPKAISDQPQTPARHKKIGRNDPCWCGSSRKWKKCHYPELPPG